MPVLRERGEGNKWLNMINIIPLRKSKMKKKSKQDKQDPNAQYANYINKKHTTYAQLYYLYNEININCVCLMFVDKRCLKTGYHFQSMNLTSDFRSSAIYN